MPLFRCAICFAESDCREVDCPREKEWTCRIDPVDGSCDTRGCTEEGVGFTEDGELFCADCLERRA